MIGRDFTQMLIDVLMVENQMINDIHTSWYIITNAYDKLCNSIDVYINTNTALILVLLFFVSLFKYSVRVEEKKTAAEVPCYVLFFYEQMTYNLL